MIEQAHKGRRHKSLPLYDWRTALPTVRKVAIEALSRALASGTIDSELGVSEADLRTRRGQYPVRVSRLYPAGESRTGQASWWHDIPVACRSGIRYWVLMGQVDAGSFEVLRVPVDWMEKNKGRFDLTADESCYRLHLAATHKGRFVERRKSELAFGQFRVGLAK